MDHTSTTFQGSVYLNPDNSYVADVVSTGVVNIFKAESSTSPMVAVSEQNVLGLPGVQASARGATDPGVVPAVRIWPEATQSYVYRVSWVSLSDQPATVIQEASFQHPMKDLLAGFGRAAHTHGVDASISSGVWSVDGNVFFVCWVDGTISRIVVRPLVRRIAFLVFGQ
jgi:hypothetical protein